MPLLQTSLHQINTNKNTVYTIQVSLKLIFYVHKTYADASHPIILQYIIDRKIKPKDIAKCLEEHWDKKNRLNSKAPNALRINHY